AGLLIHGIGGVGKSTLSAEVVRSLGDDAGVVVSKGGQLAVDDIFEEVGARLGLHPPNPGTDGTVARAAQYLRRGDVEWSWRLPGLEALTQAQRSRAYRDVGGHPRTLEYLDALLRRGVARFDDVAERMEQRLTEQGIEDPEAWMARGRDFDADLAAAVTMAATDVVLADLLEDLSRVPLARELVVGASVYRVPVDDTALVWQVTEEIDRPPDPERIARIERVEQVLQETVEQLGESAGSGIVLV